MTDLLKRLHIWVGLFNLTILLVFAATGIAVTFPRSPPPRPAPVFVPYDPPPAMTDKQIADDLLERLDLPLSYDIPDYAVSRNAENLLVLVYYGMNGVHTVTVLEAEKQVRVEHAPRSLGAFLNIMHASTLVYSLPDLRVRLWSAYVDLSIASLAFMCVSGVWLWLASRPRLWWAHAAFGGGVVLFAALWAALR